MLKYTSLMLFVFLFLISCDQVTTSKLQSSTTENPVDAVEENEINDQFSNIEKHIDRNSSGLEEQQGRGDYDDSGNGVFGRRVTTIPSLDSLMGRSENGRITVKICVNPRGNVMFSELIPEETSITDKRLLRSALKVVKEYKFEKDINAPEEQCGRISFLIESSRK